MLQRKVFFVYVAFRNSYILALKTYPGQILNISEKFETPILAVCGIILDIQTDIQKHDNFYYPSKFLVYFMFPSEWERLLQRCCALPWHNNLFLNLGWGFYDLIWVKTILLDMWEGPFYLNSLSFGCPNLIFIIPWIFHRIYYYYMHLSTFK